MKKLLLLLLTLLLLPMAVSAQEEVEIDGIYYRIEIWQAIVISHPDKYSDDIVIPSTVYYDGINYNVTEIDDEAFIDCSDLTSVVIPSSVELILGNPFQGCSSLASIVVDEGNRWYDSRDNCNAIVIKRGDSRPVNMLIAGCKNTLIPSSVTSIDDDAFSGSGLTSITIPSSVTSIGWSAFSNCSSLESVTIPASVTDIGGGAFSNCSSLDSVTIPASVTDIGGGAFSNCSSLESVTIPASVTDIGGGVFTGCNSLASIVVEEGNPQFDSRDNCNAIIDKTYDMLIAGCINTVIPSSVTIIGESAFKGLSMTSIVIPSSVTDILSYAFASCSALTDVYCFAENVPSTSSSAFNWSSYQTATLHVLATSIEKYKNAAPWKDFKNIVGDYKCATPIITFANGKLTFSCETEGVEFVASVSPSGKTTYKGSSLLLADMKTTYRVSVYARKEGFEDSEAATIDIDYLPDLDDVNGDGQISISDVVGIVDIILKGN